MKLEIEYLTSVVYLPTLILMKQSQRLKIKCENKIPYNAVL